MIDIDDDTTLFGASFIAPSSHSPHFAIFLIMSRLASPSIHSKWRKIIGDQCWKGQFVSNTVVKAMYIHCSTSLQFHIVIKLKVEVGSTEMGKWMDKAEQQNSKQFAKLYLISLK